MEGVVWPRRRRRGLLRRSPRNTRNPAALRELMYRAYTTCASDEGDLRFDKRRHYRQHHGFARAEEASCLVLELR